MRLKKRSQLTRTPPKYKYKLSWIYSREFVSLRRIVESGNSNERTANNVKMIIMKVMFHPSGHREREKKARPRLFVEQA